jgi:hypothetical protein
MSVFKKLNLSNQSQIAVCNAPDSFETQIEALGGVKVLRDPKRLDGVSFALLFAMTQAEVDRLSKLAALMPGDALVWFAYPKGSSKRYRCEFNRDTGWAKIRAAGFDSVRMVAIDEDWSALRFRRLEFIKNTRKRSS